MDKVIKECATAEMMSTGVSILTKAVSKSKDSDNDYKNYNHGINAKKKGEEAGSTCQAVFVSLPVLKLLIFLDEEVKKKIWLIQVFIYAHQIAGNIYLFFCEC